VGAVLVTTVATLGVAALALLGPLERSLRNAELNTLVKDLRPAERDFRQLTLKNLQQKSQQQQDLDEYAGTFKDQIGAREVIVFAYPLVQLTPYTRSESSDSFSDVPIAFQKADLHKRYPIVQSFGTVAGEDVARVAVPLTVRGIPYVLAVRKPITEVAGAVHVVQRAFLTAAFAGLALTVILGIPLSATLVRRLRRLRHAALRLAVEGPAVEVPEDRARDEVGDLARTFATMQRRLKQQEEARRAFVATASHELRTPLTSLDGMLELLDDDLRTGELDRGDALSLLERARAQSRRLGRLAADLLDLSRLDAQVELRSEPVELGELSRAVLAEFELGTAERRITTALDESAGSVWALGDPGSVARILRILLDNSVRMSPEGGEIRVELRNGVHASLSVCDCGPGVPPDEHELIFERFKRGRQTAGQAGFGLGLAIGRELAERMGGQLVLEESVSAGAKFTLRLPAAQAPREDPVPVG
jgi:signal transduction histidine kinase